MKRLLILTLVSTSLASMIFFFGEKKTTTIAGNLASIPGEWLQQNPHPITPANDVRTADQTFLTYPEWFLVFSPEEQANYFDHHTATSFPFNSHTSQIWESYNIVGKEADDHFAPNPGYHFMIKVIGSSATVEYAIKNWYETLIGRATDTDTPLTPEDKFNAQFTHDYVNFIKDRPWYEFDFKSQLNTLWTSTSFSGRHFLRSLERRYILTSELAVKFLYGKLIGLGTQQIYEVALPTTVVILENDSLVSLPRYDQFAAAALGIAQSGHRFKEIAGNTSAILVSVLIHESIKAFPANERILFEQPVMSEPGKKRIVFITPVSQLSDLLLKLDEEKIQVEHVFDY